MWEKFKARELNSSIKYDELLKEFQSCCHSNVTLSYSINHTF